MNIHEYQAKELLAPIRRPDPARHGGVLRARGRGSGAAALGPDVRGQGADPRRRPRQGQVQGGLRRREGRRAARQIARRGAARSPSRCWARRSSPCRRARTAVSSTASTSRKAPTSRASSISPRSSTATTSRVAFIASDGGRHEHRGGGRTRRRRRSSSVAIDPATGYEPFHGRRIAFALGLTGKQVGACVKLIGDLYRLVLARRT